MKTKTPTIIIVSIAACIALGAFPSSGNASLIDDLRTRLDERSQKIQELDKEIEAYKKQVEEAAKESQTLKGTLSQLDKSKQRVTSEINLTAKNISTTVRTIDELVNEIGDKEARINASAGSLGAILQQLREQDETSFIESLLIKEDFSEAWNNYENLQKLQGTLQNRVNDLKILKTELEQNKNETEKKKSELLNYKKDLDGKKKVVETTVQEKNQLLLVTKNKESSYQALLNEKIEKRKAFERELLEIESQLKLAVDPASLPATGKGSLLWPLDVVKITQYFGNTPFATANAQIYNGNGHSGIDLGAPTGTKVKAALGGVVLGAGDTDTVCRGASYGKWVLVRHANGLSTLYAHLSVISVTAGQSVSVGEVVGYSGNTGYSTGPHLHFTVFATEGMKITTYKSKSCGGTYTMPVADQKAYLNPLSYLP